MNDAWIQQFMGAAAAVLIASVLLPLYRIGAGPTALDRIVAVNVVGTKTAVLLVLIGELFGRVEMFVDFALAYALLNFLGSIAAARYFFKTRPHPGGFQTSNPESAS